jgi:hypothetical protein
MTMNKRQIRHIKGRAKRSRNRITEAQFAAMQRNAAIRERRADGEPPAHERTESKYRNKRVVIGERVFASMREADRYAVLAQEQAAGIITGLQCQVRFVLAPAVNLGGKRKKPALRYFADFVYIVVATGEKVVEDAKGVITAEYRIKKHLMMSEHGLLVREV